MEIVANSNRLNAKTKIDWFFRAKKFKLEYFFQIYTPSACLFQVKIKSRFHMHCYAFLFQIEIFSLSVSEILDMFLDLDFKACLLFDNSQSK